MKILIRGGTVITMEQENRILDEGVVYIQGGEIVAVNPPRPPFSADEADRVLEAGRRLILPGFVNAHGHLAMGLFRGLSEFIFGQPWEIYFLRPVALKEHLEPEDYYLGAQLLICEMIRAGITSFADINFDNGDPPVTEWIAQAVLDSGMRATLSLETNPYINMGGTGLAYSQEALQETFQRSLAFTREFHLSRSPLVTSLLGLACPPALLPEDIKLVASAAKAEGFGIQMHVAEIAHEMREWQQMYGRSPFAVLDELGLLDCHLLGGNVVFVTEEDLPILAGKPFHASTCPKNCSKMALGMLDIPLLLENDINVCLGTNEVSCNNRQDMLEEARYAALYHKMRRGDPAVLSGDQPIKLITERAGRALNTGVGVLEAGRPADLIILESSNPNMLPGFDPIADTLYAGSSGDVRTVMVAGQLVMDEGEICVINEAKLVNTLQGKARQWRKILPDPPPAGPRSVPYDMRWEVRRPEIKKGWNQDENRG